MHVYALAASTPSGGKSGAFELFQLILVWNKNKLII